MNELKGSVSQDPDDLLEAQHQGVVKVGSRRTIRDAAEPGSGYEEEKK